MSTKIDWQQQWRDHTPEFENGRAHILLPNQQVLPLLPGPGFGDCSHPTTQLVLKLMTPYVANQTVLDIGCGSGILSVAAAKMGASQAYACDIDLDAILHAKENARLNQVSLSTTLPITFPKKPVILMNMISSEQAVAWQENRHPFTTLITSGILATEAKSYLKFASKNGWQLVQIDEQDDWLGCIFKELQ